MSIKLYIKNVKPFTEVVVQAKGLKDNITVGIKCYNQTVLEAIRKEFQTVIDTSKVIRWNRQLDILKTDINLSDEAIEEQSEILVDKIERENSLIAERLASFYNSHVTHIKNASLQQGDEKKDLFIADSRDAKPVESLWETPEECLVVLLDTYINFAPFRDSLHSKILETIFNYKFETGEIKN